MYHEGEVDLRFSGFNGRSVI